MDSHIRDVAQYRVRPPEGHEGGPVKKRASLKSTSSPPRQIQTAPTGTAQRIRNVPRSLRLRSIEGRPLDATRSTADSSSSCEEPCPPLWKASGTARLRRTPPRAAASTTRGKGTEKK